MAKRLSELLQAIGIKTESDILIEGITDRYQEVKKNWLYFAIKGEHVDGYEFRHAVLNQGGIIVSDHQEDTEGYFHPCIRIAFAFCVHAFYDYPCKKMKCIGITGTNGKSSVATLIRQILKKMNIECMQIGTEGITLFDETTYTGNTTPNILTCVRHLDKALKNDVVWVVMECSSSAIEQHRTEGIELDVAILTNLSQDHLDFHGTLENYYQAKFQIFAMLKKNGIGIMNYDCTVARGWIPYLKHQIFTYGNKPANFSISNIQCFKDHTEFSLNDRKCSTKLLSEMNVYNITASVLACFALDLSYDKILSVIEQLEPVEGRYEVIKKTPFTVIVDYAHTASAFESLLEFFSKVKQKRLIVVFGCGGQREKQKRSLMGEIACKYADEIIITSDNSRDEDINQILSDIKTGCDGRENLIIDRVKAIKMALEMGQANDIIIIAGRGNEDFQIIKGKRLSFKDRDVIMKCLAGEE